MDDLISRQAAIDVLEERLQANGYSNTALVSELNRSIGYLMQLPSAQPEHGRWIREWEMRGNISDVVWSCSVCGKPKQWNTTNYCPNCGARMDGDENG